MTKEHDDLRTVPEKTQKRLNNRQVTDYRSYMHHLVDWLLNIGKNVNKAEGYSKYTVETSIYQIDKFHRFIWNEIEDGYTLQFTTDHADRYMQHIALEDWQQSYKASLQKSVKREMKYRKHRHGGQNWDPEISYYDNNTTHQPRDFLSKQERAKIREAALEYGSIPSYANLTKSERDKWKAYLAQRFEIPKNTVNKKHWKKANSYKFPSLVWTSLDAGLRPVEVERATTNWIDLQNQVLRIPKNESSKNQNNWIVALTDRTAKALEHWLEERQQYEKYQDRDELWLTRRGNAYGSDSLAYLTKKLCDLADINYENRDMTWYTIRHSVGTQMTREEGLAAAQSQLRHEDERTTMRYDQAPVEDRKNALNKMG
jgi:integrase